MAKCDEGYLCAVCGEDVANVTHSDLYKTTLDPEYVARREELVTRGYRRLSEIKQMQDTSILEFPLPEVIDQLKNRQ